MLHAHGALWKERGLLTTGGTSVAHPETLLHLLEAVWKPKEVAVVHCYGHKAGPSLEARGNRLADRIAKEAAQSNPELQLSLVPVDVLPPTPPSYSADEEKFAVEQELSKTPEGWYVLPSGQLWVPDTLARQVIQNHHESTHQGPDVAHHQLSPYLYIAKLRQLASNISQRCVLCQRNNPRSRHLPPPGIQHYGQEPFEDLQVDFTELPQCGLFRYLLVAVCTFTGWVEAYPTKTEKASEVVRSLLRDIIPRYGLVMRTIGSDNGPSFWPRREVVIEESGDPLTVLSPWQHPVCARLYTCGCIHIFSIRDEPDELVLPHSHTSPQHPPGQIGAYLRTVGYDTHRYHPVVWSQQLVRQLAREYSEAFRALQRDENNHVA